MASAFVFTRHSQYLSVSGAMLWPAITDDAINDTIIINIALKNSTGTSKSDEALFFCEYAVNITSIMFQKIIKKPVDFMNP